MLCCSFDRFQPFLQVVLVATSTTMMAMEEITATLVVWIGGATESPLE